MKKFNKYGAGHRNQPSNLNLATIGWFYKDDTADGFALACSNYDNPQLFKELNQLHDSISKIYDELGKISISEHLSELNRAIKWWTEHHDAVGRPKNKVVNWEVSPNTRTALYSICTTIQYLTHIGYIKNDNYNGMMFQYVS